MLFKHAIFPYSVELMRPSLDSATEGEAILRFLDVQLHLQGVVEEASLKEVEATLELGSVTTAFDLESRDVQHSRQLQGELRHKKDEVVALFRGIVQKKIVQLMGEVREESSVRLFAYLIIKEMMKTCH